MKPKTAEGKYMGSAKVGPKGQIVIPKEVREMFHIVPGDTLVVLADVERGIAIERYDTFEKIADAIFAGQSREPGPEPGDLAFAAAIKEVAATDASAETGRRASAKETKQRQGGIV